MAIEYVWESKYIICGIVIDTIFGNNLYVIENNNITK